MNISPDNPRPVNGAGEEQGMEHPSHAVEPETLHELARTYFGTDFPNPEHQACPDRAALLASAQTGRLPDDTLRAHLFGCSACFTEYRTALASRHAIVPAITGQASPSFWRAWPAKVCAAFAPHPGLAWASLTLLLIAASLITWIRWHNTPSSPLATPNLAQTQPSTNQSPLASVEAPTTTPQPPTNPTTATVTAPVRVDLNEYIALRDATEASTQGKSAIKLTPVPTQLRLRLPEGSPAGTYTVQLLDERSHPVATTTAQSRGGQHLNATLDLRGVAAQRYQLEVQPPSGPPLRCPVQVSARNN